MTKYLVEDTNLGFRLSLVDSVSGVRRHSFEEGSHGVIATLYLLADRTWEHARIQAQQESGTGPCRTATPSSTPQPPVHRPSGDQAASSTRAYPAPGQDV